MSQSKVETFIGFSIRSGKIIFGVDAAERKKKGVYLLVVSCDLSENSYKVALKLQERFQCALMKTRSIALSELVHRENCKLIALTDKSLSEAVLTSALGDNDFRIYPWEEKE